MDEDGYETPSSEGDFYKLISEKYFSFSARLPKEVMNTVWGDLAQIDRFGPNPRKWKDAWAEVLITALGSLNE